MAPWGSLLPELQWPTEDHIRPKCSGSLGTAPTTDTMDLSEKLVRRTKASCGIATRMMWSVMQLITLYPALTTDRTNSQFINSTHLGIQMILKIACIVVTFA